MNDDLGDLGDDLDKDTFLRFVSAPEELASVRNPRSAQEVLLRMQADAITYHARIWRVSLRRATQGQLRTILMDAHRSDFDEYLNSLSEVDRMIAECIPTRYILTNNYDAMCVKTEFGSAIVISEVLRYFLYFMNLGSLDFPEVPDTVRLNARLIAVRTLV